MSEMMRIKVLGQMHHAGVKYSANSGTVLLPRAAAIYHIEAGTAQEAADQDPPTVDAGNEATPIDRTSDEHKDEMGQVEHKPTPHRRGRRAP